MDNLIFGCRIPYTYFTTVGGGESDIGGGDDEAAFETGSYDAALKDGGIQDFNIIKYTSVVPSQSFEVPFEEAKKSFGVGSVLESIMAQKNGHKGERITAAVLLTAVYKKVDDKHIYTGSYAVEYSGHATKREARDILCENATYLCHRRGLGSLGKGKLLEYDVKMLTNSDTILHAHKFIVKSIKVKKEFGTVLATLSFISYIHPIFRPLLQDSPSEITQGRPNLEHNPSDIDSGHRLYKHYQKYRLGL